MGRRWMVTGAGLSWLAFVVAAGCGLVAERPPADVVEKTAAPVASAPPSASAAVAAEPPADKSSVPMYPVARIYSLIDVVSTDGGIEIRTGTDIGGGTREHFRYAPLVDGRPDFEQETDEQWNADTTFGYKSIAGKRPKLVYHSLHGFRSEPIDSYAELDENRQWRSLGYVEGSGYGLGIFAWSKDRLLEFRGPVRGRPEFEPGSELPLPLPKLRVVQGNDKTAPTLPKALEKRLASEGFFLDTFMVLKSGEVLAVGRRTKKTGVGTILWTDKLGDPAYFVTETEGLELDDDIEFLGGATLADVRLRVGNGVRKLEKNAWVEESKVDDKGLPDVWFGKTYVVHKDDAVFARLSKGAPYLRIPVTFAKPDMQSIAVDQQGTIWKTEDDVLLSSKKPARELLVVTEEELVAARKKSILRGGSDDVTGEPPNAFPQSTCRMHYVLLDHSAASANKDYAPILRALTGHTEFASAKFIVHKEGERQFFGAQIKDYELAAKLDDVMEKAIKGADPDIMCAEPTALREVRVDFVKGKQLP